MTEKQTLKIVPPETMDPTSIFNWVKTVATLSSEKYREAAELCETLKGYHDDLAEIMSDLVQLQKKQTLTVEEQEEAKSCYEVGREIMEAIIDLSNSVPESEGSISLDQMEQNVLTEEDSQKAQEELDQEAEVFLRRYKEQKSKLGLITQEDVAKLTGIDRRYISVIEKGKHKPQFKTLKKIADAFSIKVTDFD